MRKIHKKGIYTSILDRFQKDEVFHATQLQHNWTKEWCEYLDRIKTIDISHEASPEQVDRYASLYHFRYNPEHLERGPIQSRPDYQQTTRAVVSMNKEAGQTRESKRKRRHNYREDLDPEKFDWLFWLSHNWKWSIQWPKISRSAYREAFIYDDRWKANWWTTSWREKSRWKWNDEVLGFFCLRISHPRSGNYCVCDGGCTHTPCRHAHFSDTFSLHRVHTWLMVFAVRMSYLSISPSPFSCFICRLCCSRTVTSTLRSCLHLPCRTVPDLKAWVKRTSARAPRSLLPSRSDALHRL